jgi:hypothetical protein
LEGEWGRGKKRERERERERAWSSGAGIGTVRRGRPEALMTHGAGRQLRRGGGERADAVVERFGHQKLN